MKKIILTFWLFLISIVLLNSELLLNENFTFEGYLDVNGWSQHSGTTDRIDTITGLNFPGYISSGFGNAALVDGTSQDVNRTFTSQSSGSVYVSFLINVQSSGTTYPIHIATSGVGSFKGRLFMINDDSGDFEFGLSHGSSTADIQTTNDYSFNTTYLIVLKYAFVAGADNDEISMYVITTGFPIDEPVTPTLGPEVGTDVSEIGTICLRQSSGIPEFVIDGIRVGTKWDDAPLPVNLSSFYAVYSGGTPTLYWTTQSEESNDYWNVYRGTNENYETAAQINAEPVPGNGTTNYASDYIYVDAEPVVQNSTYWYWIEDVSTDGETVVHEPITLDVPFEDTPNTYDIYGLHQNYPNPFNPSTSISFNLDEDSNVELIIYNVKGEKIKSIFNDHVYADQVNSAIWDGNDANGKQVSSGVYFYKLITDTKEYQRKMLLVK